MRAQDNMRTAAEVLVDQLIVNGVQHVFCVPGESYLAVLDAFHDRDITVTVCRHEGGAAFMAEAVGKATGRPGICFVTRGPGSTNAAHGMHIAHQDFDAADHVRRPDRPRHEGPRRVPGARLPRRVRRHGEMGDRDRRPGARAGDRLARLLHGDQRPAGPGGDRHPRGHADRARHGAERARVRAGRDLAGRDRHDEAAEAAVGGRAPDHAARRQPLVARRACRDRPFRRALRAADRDHASAAARCSTRCIPATRAISASARIRSWSRASRRRTSCCWSAAGSARCRRRATRCSTFPARR